MRFRGIALSIFAILYLQTTLLGETSTVDINPLQEACRIHKLLPGNDTDPPKKNFTRQSTTIMVAKFKKDGDMKTIITANPGSGGKKPDKPGWPAKKTVLKDLIDRYKDNEDVCVIWDFAKAEYGECFHFKNGKWPHAEHVIEKYRTSTGSTLCEFGICRGENSNVHTHCKKCEEEFGDNPNWPDPSMPTRRSSFAPTIYPTFMSVVRDDGWADDEPDTFESLEFVFEEDMIIGADDVTLFNNTTGQPVDISAATFSYSVATCTARWDFTSMPIALEPGSYTYTVNSANIVSSTTGLQLDCEQDGLPAAYFSVDEEVAIPGDIDVNGVVALTDVIDFVTAMTAKPGSIEFEPCWYDGDFDNNDVVDVVDAMILVESIGRSVEE